MSLIAIAAGLGPIVTATESTHGQPDDVDVHGATIRGQAASLEAEHQAVVRESASIEAEHQAEHQALADFYGVLHGGP